MFLSIYSIIRKTFHWKHSPQKLCHHRNLSSPLAPGPTVITRTLPAGEVLPLRSNQTLLVPKATQGGGGGDCWNLGPSQSSPTAVHTALCVRTPGYRKVGEPAQKNATLCMPGTVQAPAVPHGFLTLDQPALKDGWGQKRGHADLLTACTLMHSLDSGSTEGREPGCVQRLGGRGKRHGSGWG